jgi:hypothetical protein
MKKFSETQKAERVSTNTRSSKKQPSLTSASNEGEEGEGELTIAEGKENGGENTNASPRNKTLLSKLGTRLRGGAGRGKKTSSSTTTSSSKKTKE